MTQFPAPLVPLDCDCRGLPFMPLETVRLRESDLAAISTGNEFKAAILLWCAAWGQVPASSLPDDDRVLARFAGFTLASWKRLKPVAMRGFVMCSDGRFYHPVIADRAIDAFGHRKNQSDRINSRWAREKARKLNENNETTDTTELPPNIPRNNHGNTGSHTTVIQGTGRVKGKPPYSPPTGKFDEFWIAYPHKVSKRTAQTAWMRAIKRAAPDDIIAGVIRDNASNPKWKDGFVPNPATWLNGDRWLDEFPSPKAETSDDLIARLRARDAGFV